MPLKPVSRIKETYQARDLWELAWSCKQLCYLCPIGPRSLPGTAQLGGPQSSKELTNPDSKVHGANMGSTWGRQDPGGPHAGHVNLAIRERFFSSPSPYKNRFAYTGIPIIKIKRPWDGTIYIMGIPILVGRCLYIETTIGCTLCPGWIQQYVPLWVISENIRQSCINRLKRHRLTKRSLWQTCCIYMVLSSNCK